jgi:extradiol dioxygenase family protein
MKGRKPIFIHYVHDMPRARHFYETVFEVSPTFASRGWTTLGFGSFELALHILSPDHVEEAPLPHAGLNLEVDLIEEIARCVGVSGTRGNWQRPVGTAVTRGAHVCAEEH